jgi:hypothetical protein
MPSLPFLVPIYYLKLQSLAQHWTASARRCVRLSGIKSNVPLPTMAGNCLTATHTSQNGLAQSLASHTVAREHHTQQTDNTRFRQTKGHTRPPVPDVLRGTAPQGWMPHRLQIERLWVIGLQLGKNFETFPADP